jgi:hypothetical protein
MKSKQLNEIRIVPIAEKYVESHYFFYSLTKVLRQYSLRNIIKFNIPDSLHGTNLKYPSASASILARSQCMGVYWISLQGSTMST